MSNQDSRKQLNEFRKAHFVIGFVKDQSTSNYQDDYISKKVDKQLPNTEEAKEFAKYIANPRKSHFLMGEDAGNYDSITKLSYDQKTMEKAQLSEATKKDLRSHHFKVGFHSVPSETEYSKFQGGQLESKPLKSVNIRKHHHDFGDLKSYYETSYGAVHQEKPISNEAVYINDMRKTNIKMGENKQVYETHAAHFHTGRQNPPVANKGNLERFLKESHLQMGNDPSVVLSENKQRYTGLQNKEVTKVNEAVLSDLRSAHFDLAYQKADQPQTTSQSAFKRMGMEISNPIHHTSTFKIGDVGQEHKKYYETHYNQIHSNPNTKIPIRALGDRKSSIDFGHEQVPYATESARNYIEYQSPPKVALNKETIRDLRNSHFEFGEDKIDYSRQQQSSGYVNAKLDVDKLNDLRRQHFVYGNQGNTYNTHNEEYGTRLGPPNQLSKETQDDLRKHHHCEDDVNAFKTSYQAMVSK